MTRRSNFAFDTNYAFPVETQPVLTQEGKAIVGHKAVRRTDNGQVLSIVSNKYNLVKHDEVINAAESFVTALGEPERNYTVARGGAVLIAQLKYSAHKVDLGLGDFATLRIYMMSSYTGTLMNKIRIGAEVLSCLNGMTVPVKQFNHDFRHVGSTKMNFPDAGQVLERFFLQGEVWRRYAEISLASFNVIWDELAKAEILPLAGINFISNQHAVTPVRTVWDLHQACTNYITHVNGSGALGKISMLDRVAKWFNKQFK